MEMADRKEYSPEAITAMEIVGSLSETARKAVVERLRTIAAEESGDDKWDRLLTENPGPAIEMAEQALRDEAKGKSKPLSFGLISSLATF